MPRGSSVESSVVVVSVVISAPPFGSLSPVGLSEGLSSPPAHAFSVKDVTICAPVVVVGVVRFVVVVVVVRLVVVEVVVVAVVRFVVVEVVTEGLVVVDVVIVPPVVVVSVVSVVWMLFGTVCVVAVTCSVPSGISDSTVFSTDSVLPVTTSEVCDTVASDTSPDRSSVSFSSVVFSEDAILSTVFSVVTDVADAEGSVPVTTTSIGGV